MRELVDFAGTIGEFAEISAELEPVRAHLSVTGIGGAARHLLYAALARSRPLLIVVHSMQVAHAIVADIASLIGDDAVYLFPERERADIDMIAYSPDMAALRIRALDAAAQRSARVLVTTIRALGDPVQSSTLFTERVIAVATGDRMSLDEVAQRLVDLGYIRAPIAESVGQFAQRGGILDIFPVAGEPLRIEWFDDEIDSMRAFDPDTQRSREARQAARILPAAEVPITEAELAEAASALRILYERRLADLADGELVRRLQDHVGADLEKMEAGVRFPALARYAALFPFVRSDLLAYVPQEAVVVFEEPVRLHEALERSARDDAQWRTSLLEQGATLPELLPPAPPAASTEFVAQGRRRLFVSLFPRHVHGVPATPARAASVRSMQQFHGQMGLLKSELQRYQKAGQLVVFAAAGADRAQRLLDVLNDFRIPAQVRDAFDASTNGPQVIAAQLSGGFELPSCRLVVITDSEVFVTRARVRRMRTDVSEAQRIRSWQELAVGDYVVHATHGIGRYLGVETLLVAGVKRDYLHLRYAGNDALYVPVDQIDLVQKYLGGEDKEPRMHHLGGQEFARAKAKVQKSTQDIAAELIKVYAARQALPGHPFRADTEWQKDFEASFPYEETVDQLRAIEEVKRDMERARPMDRLLCGDVGYGKTEVALRAAAKAVFDGKQVAMLVPTTILAEQHYETFKERFQGLPVTVESLSRFRSDADAARVMQGLKTGTVDVVIATHRLLQKSIEFKDLGLLIVDEEQRFGVTHKERLKKLKETVDCLTLTATPIPRTLHMSMVGVRDLSVIGTPPENRFPVQTYVVEYSDAVLRDAIARELGRGGQVYVLYNQVRGIRSVADRVARLVPDARVGVGHGQMGEDELERVMLDFLEGELDVLVCTTIIESGLDIPNVNTLLVYHADRLGLAQLYQLRGRVGRSNRVAFAYFTYEPDRVLTEVAEKRLQAIKEFTALGSGFKIAMRDLAIRGTGNLLGPEQHGHVASVGFEMYTQMLADAVAQLSGQRKEVHPEPTIELAVEGWLPDSYIVDSLQKIEMYKKLVDVRVAADVDDVAQEMVDRFGDIPPDADNLLQVARIRALAREHGIGAVAKRGVGVDIEFRPEQKDRISGMRLFELTNVLPRRMRLKSTGAVYTVTIDGSGWTDAELLQATVRVLRELPSVFTKEEELQGAN
ncbi:MAG: transcription-repair coupling factor [Firmicutes bacterium]|nr:transcription-repair coupling factor [Bacillota bacterium]